MIPRNRTVLARCISFALYRDPLAGRYFYPHVH